MKKQYFIFILSIFISFSAFAKSLIEIDFYKNDSRIYTHKLPMNFVLFEKGPWTVPEVKINLEDASKIYAQCGVKLEVEKISYAKGDGEVYFDLEGYTEDNEVRPVDSALTLGAKYSSPDLTTVFFMQSFDSDYQSVLATALPLVRAEREDQRDALNTIWLNHQVEFGRGLSLAEGGHPAGYNVLAHETGHVVMNTDHIEENYIHNLMHENYLNLNGHLTSSQCEKVRKSPLVKEISPPKETNCPEITSPLRGKIHFLNNSSNDCKTFAGIVQRMDQVRDSVSDLSPVGGIDFYLEAKSDLIQYSDKNSFEGSLVTTFDPQRDLVISLEQTEVLWMHELGHALLNAKLEEDWPWYQGRLDIFREWGRLIRESFRAGMDDNTNSEKIMKQIFLLEKYPNAMSWEELLAPYHELFADAVAVIYTRNPKAIKMALAHPQNPDPHSDEDRDFSISHPYETWKETEAHSMLSPVRSHIWKLISQLGPNERTNQEILRTLYEAIKEEVLARIKEPRPNEMSVPEINRRLIRRLPVL